MDPKIIKQRIAKARGPKGLHSGMLYFDKMLTRALLLGSLVLCVAIVVVLWYNPHVWYRIIPHHNSKTKISVASLTHNDERFLPHFIKSVQTALGPLLGEIVICDLKSTDHTIDIARSFGTRIVELEKVADAFARTLCLYRMETKTDHYTLWMEPRDLLFAQGKLPLLTDELYAIVVKEGGRYHYRKPLLMRATLPCTMSGLIVPQIQPHCTNLLNSSLSATATTLDALSIVRHEFDSAEYKTQRKLLDFEVSTMQTQKVQNDEYATHLFYLAKMLEEEKQYAKAIEAYLNRTLILNTHYEEIAYAHYRLATCQLALAEEQNATTHQLIEEVRARLLYSHDVDPYRVEPLYYLARIERERNNFTQCLLYSRAALNVRLPWQNALYVEAPVYNWAAQEEYATCLYYTGRPAEAQYYWQDLLDRANILELPDQTRERIKNNLRYVA